MSTEGLLWALGAVNLAGLPLVRYLSAPPLLAITAIVATHGGVINVLAGLLAALSRLHHARCLGCWVLVWSRYSFAPAARACFWRMSS